MSRNRLGRTLEDAYMRVVGWDAADLGVALRSVGQGPAVFIGTGGTLAVAQLAARLQEENSGQVARALTPLELLQLPPMHDCGAVLFSASMKHPDALAALSKLAQGSFRSATVITLRAKEDLPQPASYIDHVISLPKLPSREGFLATSSVLTMMAALIKAWDHGRLLPDQLVWPKVDDVTNSGRLAVLYSPQLVPVSTDIETRFCELGLADVQVTDYRNLAHGRHVGLSRRASEVSVIGLIEPAAGVEDLARSTLAELRSGGIDVAEWRASAPGSLGALELTIASMILATEFAEAQGVSPHRPGAPQFGRRLYHLNARDLPLDRTHGPIIEKQRAASRTGVTISFAEARKALDDWLAALRDVRFGGLVLDYDGTICPTGRRTELPASSLRDEICRILEAGVPLGVASGRGPSLHRDLRSWLPQRVWSGVTTGLYNGGVLVPLTETLGSYRDPDPLMQAVASRLATLKGLSGLDIEARQTQVTLAASSAEEVNMVIGSLGSQVEAALQGDPPLPVKVQASGHSIDVVPENVTKLAVTDVVSALATGPVLAIGDQGHQGGNDFDLLHATRWSLTVDTCSAALDRCWNLGYGNHGPQALWSYLRRIRPKADGEFQLVLAAG